MEYKDMGILASDIFANKKGNSLVITQLFKESVPLFSSIIKNKISGKNNHIYSLLDIGSYQGEFVKNIVKSLPDIKFEIFAVENNNFALEKNSIAMHKINSDVTNLPFLERDFDISIIRYVLHWNSWENQKKILSEAIRVTKDFLLIQHLGGDVDNYDDWQNRMKEIIGGIIPKLNRTDAYFSTAEEIEKYFTLSNVEFIRLQHRKIENSSQGFRERFDLTDNEFVTIKNILGDKDYVIQTTWLITR